MPSGSTVNVGYDTTGVFTPPGFELKYDPLSSFGPASTAAGTSSAGGDAGAYASGEYGRDVGTYHSSGPSANGDRERVSPVQLQHLAPGPRR